MHIVVAAFKPPNGLIDSAAFSHCNLLLRQF